MSYVSQIIVNILSILGAVMGNSCVCFCQSQNLCLSKNLLSYLIHIDAEKLESLVVQLMAQERTAHVSAISIDCSDIQSVRDAFESVRSIGVVEVLVCTYHQTYIVFALPCTIEFIHQIKAVFMKF